MGADRPLRKLAKLMQSRRYQTTKDMTLEQVTMIIHPTEEKLGWSPWLSLRGINLLGI